MENLIDEEGFDSRLYLYESACNLLGSKLVLVKKKFNELPYSINLEAGARLGDIKSITSRIKSEQSIRGKLLKSGYLHTYENEKQYVRDVVGYRIICMYERDIYVLVNLINNCNLKIVRQKDYIEFPKESGYRSYHLNVEMPVELYDNVEYVSAEIQIRTDFMDLWASREHEMIYKTPIDKSELASVSKALRDLSGALHLAQQAMERAREEELIIRANNIITDEKTLIKK